MNWLKERGKFIIRLSSFLSLGLQPSLSLLQPHSLILRVNWSRSKLWGKLLFCSLSASFHSSYIASTYHIFTHSVSSSLLWGGCNGIIFRKCGVMWWEKCICKPHLQIREGKHSESLEFWLVMWMKGVKYKVVTCRRRGKQWLNFGLETKRKVWLHNVAYIFVIRSNMKVGDGNFDSCLTWLVYYVWQRSKRKWKRILFRSLRYDMICIICPLCLHSLFYDTTSHMLWPPKFPSWVQFQTPFHFSLGSVETSQPYA